MTDAEALAWAEVMADPGDHPLTGQDLFRWWDEFNTPADLDTLETDALVEREARLAEREGQTE